jgi:NAD-dependent dihydropyrimidine dehydrogenase PreA subunit
MNNSDNKPAGAVNTGPGFMAQLKLYSCKSSYGCITACPENAITRGPDRLPANMCCSIELLPGKAVIDEAKCTGCGECIAVCPNNALEMVARI